MVFSGGCVLFVPSSQKKNVSNVIDMSEMVRFSKTNDLIEGCCVWQSA